MIEKSIVVTGSTRGIGLGLAVEFLKRGCQVTINGRSQASVDQVLSNNKSGAKIKWLTTSKLSVRFATAWFNRRDLFS